MSSWAKPGVKCVCVHQISHKGPVDRHYCPNLPVKGKTYTIRAVDICPVGGTTTLCLEGLVNMEYLSYGEVAFNVVYFRPLITRDQDIALIKSLLLTTPKPKEASPYPANSPIRVNHNP